MIRVRYSPQVGKVLWCLFGKFSSGKDMKIITLQIKKMPKEWKAKMLRAWFNDDGSVPKYGVIAIKQKLKPLILFIQGILSELGIKSQITKDGDRWLLRICSYKDMMKFKEKIDFSKGYRKSQKLSDIIEKIKRPHFETKNKILDLLKKSPKTREEISKLLSLSEGIVYGHLHGWKRKSKKSNPCLIDLGLVKVKKEGKINAYLFSTAVPSPGFGFSGSEDSSGQC